MDFLQGWDALPAEARNNLIRIGLALLVLLLIWGLRRLLAMIVVAPLRRIAKRTNAQWDDVLLDSIMLPARLLIIAVGLSVGVQILQIDNSAYVFVQHLIRTLVIVAVLMVVYQAVDALAPSSNRLFRITGLTITERLLPFVRTGVKLLVIALMIVIIVQEWGYDVSGLVAGLGIGGLAISLAAQDTIANLFGFTTIVGDQPFVVGEFIKTPDVEGTVEHVGVRSTRIRQPDQAYVTVPNSKLASSAILNWSRLSKRWLNLTLVLNYGARRVEIETFLERVRTLLSANEKVESSSIVVRLINFSDIGMEVLIRCYITIADWGEFTAEKEKVYLELLRIVEEMHLRIATRSLILEKGGQFMVDAGQTADLEDIDISE